MSQPMVSILCATYNHFNYIMDAVNSFVNQKTNFHYEIIINDDCSTDGTDNLVYSYYKKYPDIIKPIFQSTNQYSKGISIIKDILVPNAKGKYIALCEGDDFFIDEFKLQKQVDYLETNPMCSLCIHDNFIIDKDKNKKGLFIKNYKLPRIFSCDEVIRGGGGFCPTNSIMAPSTYFRNLPSFFNISSFDFVWQMHLASIGYTYCFKEPMAAYRQFSTGSWSERTIKQSFEKQMAFMNTKINVRNAFNVYTNFKYNDSINYVDTYEELCVLLENYKYSELNEYKYRSFITQLGLPKRIKLFLRIKFPFIHNLYRSLK